MGTWYSMLIGGPVCVLRNEFNVYGISVTLIYIDMCICIRGYMYAYVYV